jgi:hypothetical protein
MGSPSFLFSAYPPRLVSQTAVPSTSSARVSQLAFENCLRQASSAAIGSSSRRLAIRRLAARVQQGAGILKPVKHSTAVVIFNGDLILAIRRPSDDDELPGIWGLPAGTRRDQETAEDVIVRIGRDKLGVSLVPVRLLGRGIQDRPQYLLDMELWEASMSGVPTCPMWQWAPTSLLRPGAASGSLCCELALKIKSRVSL